MSPLSSVHWTVDRLLVIILHKLTLFGPPEVFGTTYKCVLLSAPAVLSHKHSHSGAPPHPRPGSAGHHHWHGKGGLGDPDDSSEPRGLGVCTSRARPGHGTRPRQLVCWVGQCRSRYQHGLFSRAGDTEPVYQTCDTVLSTLATWVIVHQTSP